MNEIKQAIQKLEHQELYNFYLFFNKHLTNLFKFKKHTALTNNSLKNKILALNAEDNYQELYELSKWFSSFVRSRGYSKSVRTQNGL